MIDVGVVVDHISQCDMHAVPVVVRGENCSTKLESQAVISFSVRVAPSILGSAGTAASIFNHWAISPAGHYS